MDYNFQNDIKKHEEMKQLSTYIYGTSVKELPKGYKMVFDKITRPNGFKCNEVRKDNDLVITFEGTTDVNDWRNNKNMPLKKLPSQFESAKMVLAKIKSNPEFKNCNIILTGHSLGGSIAQYLGAKFNFKTVTFNAFGTGNMIRNEASSTNKDIEIFPNNIVNYYHKGEILTLSGFKYQIGSCYKIGGKLNGERVFLRSLKYVNDNSFGAHQMESFDKLITREPHGGNREQIFCNGAQDKRIIKSHIEKPSEIMYQPKSECKGTYSVSGYTRADGIRVSSYQRTCRLHRND